MATIVEAHQWFQNGDHPEDGHRKGAIDGGELVERYCTPNLDGLTQCELCGYPMHDHGWIGTPMGGQVVCPGDWIIRGITGNYCTCKPDIFKITYEIVHRVVEEN